MDLATYEAGDGPPVILLHGFPELAFSWRHQISALASRGWRAIAPDLRGYGGTDPQGDVASYSLRNLAKDMLGLMDVLEFERAVIIGHDFGGALAWSMARDHSGRVAGVISLNTPYTRRGSQDLVRTMLQHRGETNYMVMFQQPGIGEVLLQSDVAATFRGLMRRPAMTLIQFRNAHSRLHALPMTLFGHEPTVMGEPILSDKDLAIYINAFEKTGFAGALNWYRNLERNWLDTKDIKDKVIVPALMVTASDDFFLPPETTAGMERYVPDLECRMVENCGYWTQQERPEETNTLILDWLERRMRPSFMRRHPFQNPRWRMAVETSSAGERLRQ
jgi:soluble epoxide hydrolase/lipid-phosphate phosphatase